MSSSWQRRYVAQKSAAPASSVCSSPSRRRSLTDRKEEKYMNTLVLMLQVKTTSSTSEVSQSIRTPTRRPHQKQASVSASLPYGEVQQVLGSGCLQVLDGADSDQTLLEEQLSWFNRTRTATRVHHIQTTARQLKDRRTVRVSHWLSLNSDVCFDCWSHSEYCTISGLTLRGGTRCDRLSLR